MSYLFLLGRENFNLTYLGVEILANFNSRTGAVDVDNIVLGEKSIAIIIKCNLARQSVQQYLFFNIPGFLRVLIFFLLNSGRL